MRKEDLHHVVRPLKSGGEVVVLDTGALLKPESQAMLGAMYSRSSLGIRKLLDKFFERGPDAFLRENYQIGYGHKSIGDLGDTAVFIDGVSMLCAKAIQDFPLYRGQESSTRYIDFSKQKFLNPCGDPRGAEILERWREMYLKAFDVMKGVLVSRYRRNPGEKEEEYEKAIKARAFDIVRSLLPAGATTNVAWMGDLRHINDHLLLLRNHPLEEVRGVGETIEDALMEKFPSSFDSTKRYPATEQYARQMGIEYGYFDEKSFDFVLENDSIDYGLLESYRPALMTRPVKTELPWAIQECGTMRFSFPLDFGSYRDLQRQRAVTTRMPLLSNESRWEPWYLDEMPDFLRGEILDLDKTQDLIGVDAFSCQYYVPMGKRVPIRTTGDLRALVYLVELRANRFVHPTLMRRALQMSDVLKERIGPYGLVQHLDPEPGRFDVRRGTHDIVEKV